MRLGAILLALVVAVLLVLWAMGFMPSSIEFAGIRFEGIRSVKPVSTGKDLSIKKDLEINQRIQAMLVNYNEGWYDAADRLADKVLELAPDNYRALNMKGSVSFYRGNYQSAVEYFSKAVQSKPGDFIITKNLADSYVELGGYQRAIDLYKSIEDAKPDWSYSIGRAYLYANMFSEALRFLQPVPTEYNRGTARVLEAAALAGLAREEANTKDRAQLISKAQEKLQKGVDRDPGYWDGILSGKQRDIHEGYTKPRLLLEGIL